MVMFAGILLNSPWVWLNQRTPIEMSMVLPVMAGVMISTAALLKRGSMGSAAFCGFFSALLLYTYQATRPLYFFQLAVLLVIAFLPGTRSRKGGLLALGISIVLGLPGLHDLAFSHTSLSRYKKVACQNLAGVISSIRAHLGPSFLFFKGDHNFRHHTQWGGMLAPFFLPFLLAGTWNLIQRLRHSRGNRDPFSVYLLALTVASFLPASLTCDSVPHALRSSLAILPLFTLCCLGAQPIIDFFQRWKPRFFWPALVLWSLAGFVWVGISQHHAFELDRASANSFWMYFPLKPQWNSPDFADLNLKYETIVEKQDVRGCLNGQK